MSTKDPLNFEDQQVQSQSDDADINNQTSDAAGEAAAPLSEVDTLKQQLEETQQRLLRVSADYQNFVRRSNNNIESARQEQLGDVAKSLLMVLDHFDRAMTIDPEKTGTQSLLQGVQIVRDELMGTLERFAIRQQNVKPGEEFIPGKHEAVMQQEVENMAPGLVAAVLQSGYELGDRTLRPAKVSVSK